MAFINASSPYQSNKRKTSEIMRWVILCLIPGIAIQSYYFGFANLIQIFIAALTALICEGFILHMRKRPITVTLKDNSALLTAILIAISIPPLSPWWVVTIGCGFAIIFVKQLYGGLGQNIFNPAMAAYVLLLIAFPVQMTSWLPMHDLQSIDMSFIDQLSCILTGSTRDGYSLQQLTSNIDGLSMATPLDITKNALNAGFTISEILQRAAFANSSWQAIQWVNIGFLFGGGILLYKRIIQYTIPLSFLLGLSVFSFIAFAYAPDLNTTPIFHLFSGATMLGAFFILTDPVSAATTQKGRILYGLLIALLVVLIRNIGGYPDAVAFAVLLANICVPLIDYYSQPRVYGGRT
ncbi:electron transport complex subunit RsxD [Psychromonas sp. CD1]|uniref:electron transport complex subunit RsxD n=1 Tax=Psychromonas sp. CD1 TaxID=1979839 RepID=UPI000B9C35CB|nr:electron transport complex subunit RsxD [Psychromonas sp. CD1]